MVSPRPGLQLAATLAQALWTCAHCSCALRRPVGSQRVRGKKKEKKKGLVTTKQVQWRWLAGQKGLAWVRAWPAAWVLPAAAPVLAVAVAVVGGAHACQAVLARVQRRAQLVQELRVRVLLQARAQAPQSALGEQVLGERLSVSSSCSLSLPAPSPLWLSQVQRSQGGLWSV